MEGAPQYIKFTLENGEERAFRYGSRLTNPLDQWPDPEVYVHKASGQFLAGAEARNLNRAFPGSPRGTLTEQVAYAITQLIKKEAVDLVHDMHEASPEYPVVNALVSHQRAMPLASYAVVDLMIEGIDLQLEESPLNLRGLSHRELGDDGCTLCWPRRRIPRKVGFGGGPARRWSRLASTKCTCERRISGCFTCPSIPAGIPWKGGWDYTLRSCNRSSAR